MLNLYTVKEAAVYLGVDVSTIYRYIRGDILTVYVFEKERKPFGPAPTWHVSKNDLDTVADVLRERKDARSKRIYNTLEMYEKFSEDCWESCNTTLLLAEFNDLADRIKHEDEY